MNATLASLQRGGHLRHVDAALGDWIARMFPDASDEVTLAAALAARAVTDGHSALALDRAQAWLAGLADGKVPALPGLTGWCEALRRSQAVHASGTLAPIDVRPLVLDAQGRVYLRRYFEYEQRLARALVARAGSCISRSQAPGPRPPIADIDPEQQHAIASALTHRFTLVTGGPGTGKTYSVVRMLAALAQHAQARGETLRIALSAPTGKAAARLAESVRAQLGRLDLTAAVAAQIPAEATTVHRLLGLSPWATRARHDHATPLPHDVVVVDEVSMVDLPLMVKLVDAVPESARLILLGDPGQLAAVEAGNVLGALLEAAHQPPLQDCHVTLTHSHRFAAQSTLGTLATSIAQGDVEAAMHVFADSHDATLSAPTQAATLLAQSTERYRALLEAADPAAALHAARSFRVLTALRHGTSGCIAIDRAIAARLQRIAGVRGDERWWRGRLILITVNRPELGLFNGDTGVVWQDAEAAPKAFFEGADGTPRAVPVTALPPYEGAFAQTVHKAQGSEFEHVTLVTGPDSAVLTRELLYTGVTRARASIAIHATPETLRAGIERRTLRFTGLADRLHEAAAAPSFIAESLPDGK
ncbi:MAG: exodeoxyribonuclease V subunit alpha [Rhodanobacteraceae bacterium]